MILESLHELVETLRARIKERHTALSGNEMLTRYALIDPLLRELGWDTSDPATVAPEDTSGLGRGRPDYVLLTDTKPAMVIEAKKLGSGLQQGANQAIQYAMDPNRKARYFAITDGQSWEIFDTQKPAFDMSMISFDLTASSAAEVCLQALALWRPSVAAGSVSAAQAPIIQPPDHPQQPPTERAQPAAVYSQPAAAQPEPPRKSQPRSPSEFMKPITSQPEQASPAQSERPSTVVATNMSDGEWLAVSDFQPNFTDTMPTELRFPDGSVVPIQKWFMLLTETVRWLYDNDHIEETNPYVRNRRSGLIVSDSPYHPNGRPYSQSKSVGSLYVEVHGHRITLVRKTQTVIERTGQDSAQFKVRLSS